jgi:hypothetical protein
MKANGKAAVAGNGHAAHAEADDRPEQDQRLPEASPPPA